MKQLYNTALYMRLSRDDETYGDSVSIESQRIILQQYAREHDLHVIGEYIDDGWSGTNFDRPNFQRMMNDVENGKINCIVTKDLSRFGREHVMMDYYLEFVFPEKRVRYIAIAENEDTEKGLSDFVPFKNLFNEWYAKDTSRKVKTAFHAHFSEGEHICVNAPLGYKKNPVRRNTLIINKETSWIIEKIFELAVHGDGASKIMKILTQEHIPTPGWFCYQETGAFRASFENKPESKIYQWNESQVKKILKDETYIGNTIHYRQRKISYKNQKKIRNPEEAWYRVENTHEAIISKEIFNQVQEQIANRRRCMRDGTSQIFSGLLKCPDCGLSLRCATHYCCNVPYKYFTCSGYSRFGSEHCSSHYIRYDTLYPYVLSRIQYWANRAEIDETELLEYLKKTTSAESSDVLKKLYSEQDRAEKRKTEVDHLFSKIYEDWVTGTLSEYNFTMLSQKYQKEQSELDNKISKLKNDIASSEKNQDNADHWLTLIKQYSHPTELTAELLNTLIKKIEIHEPLKLEDGTKEYQIDIYYRFIGKID